ncbi:hypothetical protein GNI_145840 [Gregarina niphandrodes]|uniref:Uncharacterized protein n=1 Tax=Gregarina niphandrodes TaxID=110365 RepID=A0A023B0L2_GRENI|nr:hypothetical protein GNI_145840 [Gregarina niphandrodes]EZG44585.1 hypothetical protein GNI_145840 [Gregarina niphandrodes]|eukprot:XP_011134151.1 hypothetical protein GNI_145840 [Gregarina niphandrodes]
MKPQSMVKAAPGGWKTLDWSQVNGGKVICADENGQDMTCHYFGDPFKYDLPTVWDAVNYYLEPYQCLFTDNGNIGDRLEYRGGRARGIGKWVGKDLYGCSDSDALLVGFLVQRQSNGRGCDSDGPTCRTNVSEHCQCQDIELSAEAATPSGTIIKWGKVRDYFTNQTDLVKYYTLFQRKEYKLTNCHVKCLKDGNPEEHRRDTIEWFDRNPGPHF